MRVSISIIFLPIHSAIANESLIVGTSVTERVYRQTMTQLIADTLNCQPQRAEPLANLLFQKTQGNPFFFTQLLKSLYQDELLTFDPLAPLYDPPLLRGLRGDRKGCWQRKRLLVTVPLTALQNYRKCKTQRN